MGELTVILGICLVLGIPVVIGAVVLVVVLTRKRQQPGGPDRREG